MTTTNPSTAPDRVVIRFAGDSGDGMQLTGARFTETSALAGNDISTFPDYPAEIRAPAGSLGGVSGFQIQFASTTIFTPGDRPDVLIAMNPAALARNVAELPKGAVIIVDEDQFTEKNINRAGFEQSPLEDGSLDRFRTHPVPITKATLTALEGVDLTKRQKERSRNFFALGISFWMYGRSLAPTLAWVDSKFGATAVGEANKLALQKGYDYGMTAEIFASPVVIKAAEIAPGTYRSITGNQALALGLAVAGQLAGREVVYAGYPITPASDVLHELSRMKHFSVKTIQAEDEIAAACMAIGASYGGSLGVTASSGPGIALKGEAIGLAVSTELPLVILNVQRAGPSTGMPTKVEQSDLNMCLFGRNGESPMVVLAAQGPSDCFDIVIEAVRIATKYMVPVFVLSDAYAANGAEPWKLPDVDSLPNIRVENHTDPEGFEPFMRDPETLARPWAVPGTPGLEHRIGGLEKAETTGHISYEPLNHERMSELRQQKVDGIANDIPALEVFGDDEETLVLSWGSTFGAVRAATTDLQKAGAKVSHAHLRYLSPFPANLADILARHKRILIPELNMGQLAAVIRSDFPVQAESIAKIQGQPFKVSELVARISDAIRK
ncbi:MAG: 2-oxoglutarate ferredoxin oxidoreductase subunit alpha [Bradymonadia bacterium]|jgi:2-oxoglutarate ferredoxin oxidoreductase subunit alpha